MKILFLSQSGTKQWKSGARTLIPHSHGSHRTHWLPHCSLQDTLVGHITIDSCTSRPGRNRRTLKSVMNCCGINTLRRRYAKVRITLQRSRVDTSSISDFNITKYETANAQQLSDSQCKLQQQSHTW